MVTRNIGIEVAAPKKACTDAKCPFHGNLPVRGQILHGRVVSAKMDKAVVVERERLRYVPKFERYEKRTTRVSAHSPPCIGARLGDDVTIMECRPLSKTIHFCVIEARKGRLIITGEDYTVETAGAASTPEPEPSPEGKKPAAKRASGPKNGGKSE
ncbi:MAG: 30S ribosomal protein S17 [Methanobacteriota archaeon]